MTMRAMRAGRRAVIGGMLAVLRTASARAEPEDASQPIRAFNAGLLAIMRAGKTLPVTQRFDMLAPAVDRIFDLDAILQAAVGASWAELAEADKTSLRTEFRRFSIASWVANFDSFSGEEIIVQPEQRALGDGRVVVETRMAAPGGTPVALGYVMRRASAGWQAVDILAEGTISRVAVLRSDFRRVLARGGGGALAAQLRDKTAALLAGEGG